MISLRAFKVVGLIILCSCSNMKHSPTNEYRQSKFYNLNLKSLEVLSSDSVHISNVLITSAVLHYAKVLEEIELNNQGITEQVTRAIMERFRHQKITRDSVGYQIYHDKQAINNNWGQKVELFPKSSSGLLVHTYVELTVRTGPEFDGGGGISLAYRTGNRKYWITYGLIIALHYKGQKVYSRGYYTTEFWKFPEEVEMTFDFPEEKLDSLLSFCLKDIPLTIDPN